MDPGQFFASSRVLIVAGKGGVGKTTASATLALAAAQTGRSVLLVEVAGRSATAPMFGAEAQGYEETTVYDEADGGSVKIRSITPDAALVEWLSSHGFARIAKRMAKSGLLEIVATATPGIKDLLVLGRVKALESQGAADLIIVDAPSSGHAIQFLQAPAGVKEAARTGVLHRQAIEVLEMLEDSRRCRAMLVSIPEETPINELTETAFAVEDEVGLALGPVVINGILPPIDDLTANESGLPSAEARDIALAAELRRSRLNLQATQLDRLHHELPLPQIRLPQLFTTEIGLEELHSLAQAAVGSIEALKDWA
ncbi:MAG: anion-transporting ArsA/GET3 family ATPase [Candidatus Aldehydirespiratoraceae bacterium]|jgi:anion-transporting  ArsA/GET3 family ATPase